jgi:hypothetical protein
MADETPETSTETAKAPTAAEKAAAEKAAAALKEASAPTPQEAQAAETAEMLQTAKDDGEKHVISDLMQASTRIFGVPSEVVAGAAHFAGLEMTDETSIPELANTIQAFMAEPA